MSTFRVRVIDLETAGNGLSDVCEIGWQDVVHDIENGWIVAEERGSHLVNPGRPISPETMAVHHILDEHVIDAPYWKEIAPKILRPSCKIDAFAAHRASFEQRYCTPRLTGAQPWICTWKSALRLWPELPRFSNQMLRYQRRPQGLIHQLGLPAHRAMPDAYVTAHHLRDQLNATSLEQLLAWSSEPGLLPRVPSGADRGKGFDRVSTETLVALLQDRDVDVRFTARTELTKRGKLEISVIEEPVQRSLL